MIILFPKAALTILVFFGTTGLLKVHCSDPSEKSNESVLSIPDAAKTQISKEDLDKVARKCAFKKGCILKSLAAAGGVVGLGLGGYYGIPWLLDKFMNSANSTETITEETNMPSKPKEAKKPDNTDIDDTDSSSFSWTFWIFLGVFLSLLVLPIISVLFLALWYRYIRPRVQVCLSDPFQDAYHSDSSVASSTNSIYGPPPREPFPPRRQNPDIPSPLFPNASYSNLSSLETQSRAEELGLRKSQAHQFLDRRYSA